MNQRSLRELLDAVRAGRVTVDAAVTALRDLPYDDLGFAGIDQHRELRQGRAESVFCPGKTAVHIVAIIERLVGSSPVVVAMRTTPEAFAAIKAVRPEAVYHEAAPLAVIGRVEKAPDPGRAVGVAGIHRLLGAIETLRWAEVVIVVAGMDGALPCVVGGRLSQPVMAVPTGGGYGASFGGLAALLAMLNS